MKGDKNYKIAQLMNSNLYKGIYDLKGIEYEEYEYYDLYRSYLRKAAYQGHAEGQYDLALTYEDISFLGVGSPDYSPKKAFYWYTKACQNDIGDACNNLAMMYEKGLACEQDINKALLLYKKAASLGSDNGKNNLRIFLRQIKEGKYSL